MTRQLLHDLRVHQIELEMQNEELRRTQEQLELSRARYFDLYDMAPVGYLTLTRTGLIQEANFTIAGLLGVARSALVSQPLSSFIVPADQDIYYRHRKELLDSGARQSCELRMLRSDAANCWVRLDSTWTKDVTGALVFRMVVSDIGARRHAEDTLRASEARHRILFEMSHDALMTLAPPEWNFTSANSTALALFGAEDQASFVARSPATYSPVQQPDGSASVDKAAAMITKAMAEGSQYYEWTYRDLSGREFPASVLLTRVEIDGQPLLQATVRDETAVKRLQALLSQADRLASMGMLAAGVAHEINNPLTYVLYNVEALTEDLPKLAAAIERRLLAPPAGVGHEESSNQVGDDAELLEPSKLKELIESARDALEGTKRIQAITKVIGGFSRVESGERSAVDLNHAIEGAAAMARNDIRFRATLTLDLAPLPPVWASEGKLSQVFLNLLVNAAQAIDEGNAQRSRIDVRTWLQGDAVCAEVKDTGKGISEQNLARVFDPFFTTKSIGEGSGLGLAICRNILTDFGGEIQVESELGKGTRVTVRLPIHRAPSQATPVEPARQQGKVSRRAGRVLVVDDEQAIRTVMERLLGSEHEVITAASGRAAQTILVRDQAFDVILCDLMMPEMTGMDLHAWLLVNYPALARNVVFLTGGAFTPNASAYVERVGTGRLEKPCHAETLRRLVSDMIASAEDKH